MRQPLLIATTGLREFERHTYTQNDQGFDSLQWEHESIPFRLVIRESPYGFRVFMRGEFSWFDVTNLLSLETLESAAKYLDNALG